MDLESTLATLETVLPEALDSAFQYASAYIPEELGRVIKHASHYMPSQLDLESIVQFLLYFSAASLILGCLGRVALGKRSSLNHALSSAMGILLIYALTMVVYTFRPWKLAAMMAPLPFVTFAGDYLIVLPITDTQLPALCSEVLSMIILAFLINLVDTVMPRGRSVLSWYLLRFLGVGICMALHLAVRWAFESYAPQALVTYAPAIVLMLLVLAVMSGALNLILGVFIAMSNPFLGAMYSFFFSNIVGKQLTKAIFTASILISIVYLLGVCGYTVISITAASLTAYIPLALVALLLWYLIGHVL